MEVKEIFSKNLRYYMDVHEKTRRDICDDLGFNYYTVTAWVNGSKYPRMDKVEILAKYFGIKKSDLVEEHTNDNLRGMLPIIGSVAAGVPIEESQDIDGYAEVSGDTRNTYALRVHGDSMYPEFHDGDTVIIKKQNSYKNGDIVVARVNGYEYTIKKYRRNNNDVLLIPVNSDFEPMVYDESVIAIEGRVVEARRKY